jgi:hypothetical protein
MCAVLHMMVFCPTIVAEISPNVANAEAMPEPERHIAVPLATVDFCVT